MISHLLVVHLLLVSIWWVYIRDLFYSFTIHAHLTIYSIESWICFRFMRGTELSRHVKLFIVLTLARPMHDRVWFIFPSATSHRIIGILVVMVLVWTSATLAAIIWAGLSREVTGIISIKILNLRSLSGWSRLWGNCLSLLHLICSVHFLEFDLSLLAQFWVVDQITLNGLDNAFGLTVNEDFLNAKEGFFNSARVINVNIVV